MDRLTVFVMRIRLQPLFAGLFLTALATAAADHRVILRDGRVQEGEVLEVSDGTVQLRLPQGAVGLPLAAIERVEMPAPPELERARRAYADSNYQEAQRLVTSINDKFLGLPTPWAEESALFAGDILVELEQYEQAEASYERARTLYPASGGERSTVGMARIAVARGDLEEAGELLEPFSELALREKNPTREQQILFSQVFYVLGRIAEAEGNYPTALQNYMRTVAIFPENPSAVESARQRADVLREEHNVIAP